MAYQYATWTPDLITGHNIIDNQHQQLIIAVNNLFEAHRNGKGPKEVDRTMDFLVAYTIKHFNDEQALQEKYGYPEYPAHRQIHEEFKKTARELADALHRNGPTQEFVGHVCLTIGRWVVNHIKAEDFKMVSYLRSKEQDA